MFSQGRGEVLWQASSCRALLSWDCPIRSCLSTQLHITMSRVGWHSAFTSVSELLWPGTRGGLFLPSWGLGLPHCKRLCPLSALVILGA